MQRFIQHCPKPLSQSPIAPAAPELHVLLHSFTANNIISGTVLSFITDLGSASHFQTLDLGAIERALASYTVPPGLDSWKLPLLEATPQFFLSVELVGQSFTPAHSY